MAVKIYREKQLQFSFPSNLLWEELDQQDVKLPNGMSLVDIVIERDKDILLVEIKDPSNTNTPPKEQGHYLKRLQGDSLITQELTPKIRDSYTYLHLMNRDKKPIIYIVLLGLEAFNLSIQKELMSTFKDRLLKNISCETDIPWKRKYIKDCIVMSIEGWNGIFKEWPVQRMEKAI